MMSLEIPDNARHLKTTTALIALSLLASCATTKTPGSIADQGSIGDTDAPQVVFRDKGQYRDPRVSTAHDKADVSSAKTSAANPSMIRVAQADVVTTPDSAPAQTNLFASHVQAPTETANNNSIVPSGMPTRSIQATVTSVYSFQKPVEQQVQIEPTEPTPAPPVEHQQRRPSKAEILAGLAPDPSKRQQMPRMRQTIIPGQITPTMASQLSPAETARLQASIPTATPAAADSTAASQMEQIEGAPQAQGMTRDSFIKKFLAKLRN